MNDIAIYILVVGAALFFLLRLARRNRRPGLEIEFADVFTNNKDDAEFYVGKTGEEITNRIAMRVYERDGYKCTRCGVKGVRGNPDGLGEWLKVKLGARRVLNVDHRIAKNIGGKASKPKYLRLLCQKHNIRKLDKVGRDALELCREEGWKIYRPGIKLETHT